MHRLVLIVVLAALTVSVGSGCRIFNNDDSRYTPTGGRSRTLTRRR